MRRTLLSAAVLALLAAVGRAAPDDDGEVANARAEFEAIVRAATSSRRLPHGPSPTSLVQTLLDHGPAVVRRAESDVWAAAARDDLYASDSAFEIETLIRFLHGMPPVAYSPVYFERVADAVVFCDRSVVTQGFRLNRWKGEFNSLVADHPLRTAPAPEAAALLAAAEAPGDRLESERLAVAAASGEACGRNDAAFLDLCRRASTPDAFQTVALGWTGRAQAVPIVAGALRRLLAAAAGERIQSFDGWDAIDAAAVALHRLAPTEFDRLVAATTLEQGDRVVSAIGGTAFVDRVLAGLRSAKTDEEIHAARSRICRVAGLASLPLDGPGVERVLRALLDACDDPRLRGQALSAAGGVLRAKTSSRFGTGGGDAPTVQGERIGWPGTVEQLLRRVVIDFEAGRLVAVEEAPGFFEPRPPEDRRRCDRARTDVSVRDDAASQKPASLPLRVSAAWTKDGLRMKFVNEGPTALALDGVGLGYCAADVVTLRWPDGKTPVERRLRLHLGRVGLRTTSSSKFLVVLAPGATHECEWPVASDLRGVDHVEADFDTELNIVGASRAPLVRFEATVVL